MRHSRNGIGRKRLMRPTPTVEQGPNLSRTFSTSLEVLIFGGYSIHNKGRSSARLDYFLISKDLFQSSTKTTMRLGDWYKNASDHVRITCRIRLKEVLSSRTTP